MASTNPLLGYLNPTANNLEHQGVNNGGAQTGITPQYAQQVLGAYQAATPQQQAQFASMLAPSTTGGPLNNGVGTQTYINDDVINAGMGNPDKGPGGFFGAISPILDVIGPIAGMAGGPSLLGSLFGSAGQGADIAGSVGNDVLQGGTGIGDSLVNDGGAVAGEEAVQGAMDAANPAGAAIDAAQAAQPLTNQLADIGIGGASTGGIGGFLGSNPLLASAGLSAGGSIIGNLLGAKAQTAAGNAANTRLQPFTAAGESALNPLMALTGAGPNGAAGISTALNNMPGYQFQRNQALQAVNNQASAQGLGSNSLLQSAQTANNVSGTNYQNYVNNLLSLAGIGQTSATQQGNNTMGIGNAQGGAAVASGNAVGSAATLATLGPALINSLRGSNSAAGGYYGNNNSLGA